eukprot:comp19334_c0_seq1/m.22252 comp19334_c0_seq1/g.22252  ORF comp19334_c0_seq1/g.22252 comp19334_c0_seq1/m.22252 type:complete len:517 (-) comp19334_c0_seq1:447-1997(-)
MFYVIVGFTILIVAVTVLYQSNMGAANSTEKPEGVAGQASTSAAPAPVSAAAPTTALAAAALTGATAASGQESAEWLNTMLKQLWPYIDGMVQGIIKNSVEPTMNKKLPGMLAPAKFEKCSLGSNPLRIEKVTVHTQRNDSMLLDMDIVLNGNPDISLSLSGGSIELGVAKLVISGRLCVLMKPLLPVSPLVGAIQAAFINPPTIDLDFTGLGNIADVSFIKSTVHSTIDSVLAGMLVYPNRFLSKLSATVDFFDCYHPPMGLLRLTVVEGTDFSSSGVGVFKQKPDVYVKAWLGAEELKTKTVEDEENPKFNTTKDMLLYDTRQSIKVEVFDSDVGKDTFYGGSTFETKDLLANGEMWITLNTEDEKKPRVKVTGVLHSLTVDKTQAQAALKDGCSMAVAVVLVDGATGLQKTKGARVKVSVGEKVQETHVFAEGEGIDTTKPTYNKGFTFLLDNLNQSVVFDVLSGDDALGSVTIPLTKALESRDSAFFDWFPLEKSPVDGAKLRAKVQVFYVQ